MHLLMRYLNVPGSTALLLACSLQSLSVSAVILNFSANIVPTTCDVSLSRDELPLGIVPLASLRAGGRIAEQATRISISNCEGSPVANGRRVAVKVSGEGLRLANGQWVFRSNESEATGVGALLEEVRSGGQNVIVENGDFLINAETLPTSGNALGADLLVALTCGSTAAQCKSASSGRLIARIHFDFVYH